MSRHRPRRAPRRQSLPALRAPPPPRPAPPPPAPPAPGWAARRGPAPPGEPRGAPGRPATTEAPPPRDQPQPRVLEGPLDRRRVAVLGDERQRGADRHA